MQDDALSLAPSRFCWSPQPGPQTDAIEADWCPELLYGGAAGGGKSDFLLGDYLQDVDRYGPWWQGVMFRRTYPELESLIGRAHELFPLSGAVWHEQKKQFVWPNGATLRMRYLERYQDATRYQGHQYTWVGWDELGQWADDRSYRYLRARLRSAHAVPTKRIRCSANPGGVGHHWIKRYFIDPCPMGYSPLVDEDTSLERMFIPSKILDNTILLANDPDYINRLKGLGSPELVRAWLEGDWSVIAGAFFPEFSMDAHVVQPRSLPAYWHRFRSLDWGSARPFSVGWWAVSDGELPEFPRGALIRYREWYGSSAPNVGLRMTAEEVADGIKIKEKGDVADGKTFSGVADPAIYSSDGGPSIADRMSSRGVYFRPADNSRVAKLGALGGWDQLRSRLKGDGETPAIYFFSTCVDTIRTLPALQHDEDRPEDVDSDGEDHAPDEIRYACLSRPYTAPLPAELVPERDKYARKRAVRKTGSFMGS